MKKNKKKRSPDHSALKHLYDNRPRIFWLGVVSSSITITKEVVHTIDFLVDFLATLLKS